MLALYIIECLGANRAIVFKIAMAYDVECYVYLNVEVLCEGLRLNIVYSYYVALYLNNIYIYIYILWYTVYLRNRTNLISYSPRLSIIQSCAVSAFRQLARRCKSHLV
jgi:hypothetical protein